MLTLKERGPVRVVLREAQGSDPEAFVLLAPITPPMRRRAYRAAMQILGIDSEDGALALPVADIGEAVSGELIRLAMIEWGGIGAEDGTPLALTPDKATRYATAEDLDRPRGTIDLLLDDEDIALKLDRAYVVPDALERAEKNGFTASPSGIGGAETPESDTASLSAGSSPGTDSPSDAKAAPTAKTASGQKPRSKRGKS